MLILVCINDKFQNAQIVSLSQHKWFVSESQLIQMIRIHLNIFRPVHLLSIGHTDFSLILHRL